MRFKAIFAAGLVLASVAGARAELSEVTIAQQFGVSFLPLMLMEHQGLVEKHAMTLGIKLKANWIKVAGPSVMNDGLLSGTMHIVSQGAPSLITLWDKTIGTSFEVKGICALSSQPFLLNTSNPAIKSIRDFSERDRIALPSIKVSVQAVVLQMAVAQAFGEENYARLDSLTVSMSPPDATIALLTGSGNISTVFSVPPFQMRNVLSSTTFSGVLSATMTPSCTLQNFGSPSQPVRSLPLNSATKPSVVSGI